MIICRTQDPRFYVSFQRGEKPMAAVELGIFKKMCCWALLMKVSKYFTGKIINNANLWRIASLSSCCKICIFVDTYVLSVQPFSCNANYQWISTLYWQVADLRISHPNRWFWREMWEFQNHWPYKPHILTFRSPRVPWYLLCIADSSEELWDCFGSGSWEVCLCFSTSPLRDKFRTSVSLTDQYDLRL